LLTACSSIAQLSYVKHHSKQQSKGMIMNKFLLIFSFILMTFLASVAIASEQGQSNANLSKTLNHLVSEKQL